MSKVLVTESYLTAIGDAIRSKNSSTDRYKPSEMAGAINDITTQDNTVLNSILDRSISGNYVNDDLTEVGDYAFTHCALLTAATFTKVTKVGEGAFYFCRSLESISLPEVKEIKAYSFNYCSSLKSINIPSTIQSIIINAFNGTGITTINIDKPADSIPGAPWGATGAKVYWQGKLSIQR